MEKTEMTISEAIAAGYECALSEDAGYYSRLEDISQYDLADNFDMFLGSKETFRFKISERAMKDIIEAYIENQDEVNDENEQLYDHLSKIDFTKVCEIVNAAFTTDYHTVTDIKVVPDSTED